MTSGRIPRGSYASMPRRFFNLDVGAGALLMTAYLWSWVAETAKRSGGPHWVAHTREQVAANVRGVTDRTITDYLKRLRGENSDRVKVIEASRFNRRQGYWLFTPTGYEDQLQAPDRPLTEKIEQLIERSRRSADGDPGSILPGSPTENFQDLPPDEGDPGSFASSLHLQNLINNTAAAVATRSPGERAGSAAAAASDLPLRRRRARSLLTELAPKLGLLGLRLPPTPRAVELLGLLLDVPDGTDADADQIYEHVQQTVLAFAQLCTRVPGQRRFLGAEMFHQEIREGNTLSNWGAIEFTVRRDLEAQHDAAAAAEAERVARVERERREAEEKAHLERHRMSPDRVAQSAGEFLGRLTGRPPIAANHEAQPEPVDERERHRQLVAFRSQLERLGQPALREVEQALGQAMAVAQREDDADQVAAVRARQLAVRNRLSALGEASHA